MLNRRQMLLRGSACAAALASLSRALPARAREMGEREPAGSDVVAWIRNNALPLATAEPRTPFHDLAPLRARLAEARVVGLGESTHGTREFFQLKHRFIEYCVSQLGFTVIAFEANYGTMLAVNDYVLGGNGDVRSAAAGLGFQVWDTQEVTALIECVRA